MRAYELRELTDEQLRGRAGEELSGLYDLRFRAATNQLPDSNLPRMTRRSIARVLTVMNERGLKVD